MKEVFTLASLKAMNHDRLAQLCFLLQDQNRVLHRKLKGKAKQLKPSKPPAQVRGVSIE